MANAQARSGYQSGSLDNSGNYVPNPVGPIPNPQTVEQMYAAIGRGSGAPAWNGQQQQNNWSPGQLQRAFLDAVGGVKGWEDYNTWRQPTSGELESLMTPELKEEIRLELRKKTVPNGSKY